MAGATRSTTKLESVFRHAAVNPRLPARRTKNTRSAQRTFLFHLLAQTQLTATRQPTNHPTNSTEPVTTQPNPINQSIKSSAVLNKRRVRRQRGVLERRGRMSRKADRKVDELYSVLERTNTNTSKRGAESAKNDKTSAPLFDLFAEPPPAFAESPPTPLAPPPLVNPFSFFNYDDEDEEENKSEGRGPPPPPTQAASVLPDLDILDSLSYAPQRNSAEVASMARPLIKAKTVSNLPPPSASVSHLPPPSMASSQAPPVSHGPPAARVPQTSVGQQAGVSLGIPPQSAVQSQAKKAGQTGEEARLELEAAKQMRAELEAARSEAARLRLQTQSDSAAISDLVRRVSSAEQRAVAAEAKAAALNVECERLRAALAAAANSAPTRADSGVYVPEVLRSAHETGAQCSVQLEALANAAEAQLKALLAHCSDLRALSLSLSSLDRFASLPP
jgi:hypothetical protein